MKRKFSMKHIHEFIEMHGDQLDDSDELEPLADDYYTSTVNPDADTEEVEYFLKAVIRYYAYL